MQRSPFRFAVNPRPVTPRVLPRVPRVIISLEDYQKLVGSSLADRQPLGRTLQIRRWRALNGLLEAFRIRDRQTWKHSRRVHDGVVRLAKLLELTSPEIQQLQLTALLHDIGKIAVCDGILNKQDSLTHQEIDSVRQHPILGERLVRPLIPRAEVLRGIRHHHERMDGRGYPDGLSRKGISFFARLISVVDVYDALTHQRPYRHEALSPFAACEILTSQCGDHLDTDLVDAFCRMIRSEAETMVDIH